ncbi:MAG: hypothetical protein IJT18_03355 [Oscillospiraceae bacterium]|nr:hypothetical protein [Oscillospiraceae bacterium]
MRELVDAVMAALRAAGLTVTEKFPNFEAKRLRQPVVAVSLRALRGEGSGLTDYLGETEDGTARYGKRCEAEFLCRIAAPIGSSTREPTETVCAALLGGVAGMNVRSVTLDEVGFDTVADCYMQDVTLTAGVYLYAEQEDIDAAFEDFKLECECK